MPYSHAELAAAVAASIAPRVSDLTLDGSASRAPEAVAALWERLRGPVSASVRVAGALSDLQEEPKDPDLTAAFRAQLKKLFQGDATLAADAERLLDAVRTVQRGSRDGVEGTPNSRGGESQESFERNFFISRAGSDRAWAEWIAWVLEDEGYSVVLQDWDFRPGQSFVGNMERALLQTDATICVLSSAFNESPWTELEWSGSLTKDPTGADRKLILVRVEEVDPPALLKSRIFIDLVGHDEDSSKKKLKLLAGISDERQKSPSKTTFPGKPVFPPDIPPVDPDTLRTAYLHHVVEATSRLALDAIDPKAASSSKMVLAAVYTGQRIQAKENVNLAVPDNVDMVTLRSALDEMNQKQKLVLLGGPGSGKSTLVNFIALCLAGEALGRTDVNIATLTAPLPQAGKTRKYKDKKPVPQQWDHGALLSVRVSLKDLSRYLPRGGDAATIEHLWHLISDDLAQRGLEDYIPYLRHHLLENGGLLMLDGLDEVPEPERQRPQIKHLVENFAATFFRCRVLVTSRTYAYQRKEWRLSGFGEAVLTAFEKPQIRQFVDRWYTHAAVTRALSSEDAQGRAERLKRAIFSGATGRKLQELAKSPLLLTLIASLYTWGGQRILVKREELYHNAVALLLHNWEERKIVLDEDGSAKVQPSLAEWLQTDQDAVRDLLDGLAYQAHAAQKNLEGTADIAESTLVQGLVSISKRRDVQPRQLIGYLSGRAGLLLPHVEETYHFPHRTFQEYLAACHLSKLNDFPDILAELVRQDPLRWREVAVLAGAKVARGALYFVWDLVDALYQRDHTVNGYDESDHWAAIVAGQVLAETIDFTKVQIQRQRQNKSLDRVRADLIEVLNGGMLPPVDRAAGGDALAAIGDPRWREDAWFLPNEPLLGFVEISQGEFSFGTNEPVRVVEPTREFPLQKLELPTFYIARYPVTVAQFRAFVEDVDYRDVDESTLNGAANHPVTFVSWYDSIAYCNWLTQRLTTWDDTPEPLRSVLQLHGWRITLPSEAEWEKAARGDDGRIYTWGDDPDPEWANTRETTIGGPSSVGAFPGGRSPYGILDMCGNTLEWTRNRYGERDKVYDHGEQEELGDDEKITRVLRGGTFFVPKHEVQCTWPVESYPNRRIGYMGFRVVASPIRGN